MKVIQKHYERYWTGKSEEFSSYERNLKLTQFFQPGEYILDVGCGDGAVGQFFKEHLKARVAGIDISTKAVKQARSRGVDARVTSSEDKFPFADATFDAVFWGDNIEHLFNPLLTAQEIKRVLKEGGRLVLSCPNMGYWRYRLYYLMTGQLPDTEWTGQPSWSWSHIRFFNLPILDQFIKKAGFAKITKVVGVSRRRLDRPLLNLFPQYFGMILIVGVQ